MKIVQLSTFDNHGGAGIAANLLHNSFNKSDGIQSIMLVCYKRSNDPAVIQAYDNFIDRKTRRIRYKIDLKLGRFLARNYGELYSPGFIPFSRLHRKIENLNPDIVHIHWVQYGFMNVNDIKRIRCPIVWTLHDLWPLSDGLHSFGMDMLNHPRYKLLFNLKKKIYRNADIHFIAVSSWVKSMLEKSLLTQGFTSSLIPDGVDCIEFSPVNKTLAKEALKLDLNKKVILFGAVSPFSSKNKGFHLLEEALISTDVQKVQLFYFGDDAKSIKIGVHNATCLGKITNRKLLSLIYSAADVMVVPSYYETFGLTAAEAMACGTPVVAFNTSGLRDIIDHRQNGFLAEPYVPAALSEGINWILDHTSPDNLYLSARKKITDHFNINLIADKHIALYKNILQRKQIR